jgi:DhnA family fructose-bisphosphate aldolase class Ia
MLKKYIQPFFKNNKCFIVAYDQGLGKSTDVFKHQSQNPLFIYNLAKSINATGLIVNKGVAEIFFNNHWNKVPLIVKLDYKDNDKQIIIPTCSPSYAKSLGAKAIGYTIYFGSPLEKEQIKQFAQISEQAHSLKMGVVL